MMSAETPLRSPFDATAHTPPSARLTGPGGSMGRRASPWLARIALTFMWVGTSGSSLAEAQSPALVEPNAQLLVQGIPPIEAALAERVAPYTEVRGHSFADWHPQRLEMLVSHRPAGASTTQLFRLGGPLKALQPLTQSEDPVSQARYEPQRGRYIVYTKSSGGNEVTQLFRLDPNTRQSTQLTSPEERHEMQAWLNGKSQVLVTSVPIDRTAKGGSRSQIETTLRLLDPMHPEQAKEIARLPGGGWSVASVSPDDRTAAMTLAISANESQVWLLDLSSGERRQVLPRPDEGIKGVHLASRFLPGGQRLLVVSDRASEFRELMAFTLSTGELQRISAHIPWDVSGVNLSHDGQLIAAQFNIDGRDELRLFSSRGFQERALPRLPAGSVGNAVFHRRLGSLAFSINGARSPSQLFALDVNSQRFRPWTEAVVPPGLDVANFQDQQVIRWKSFDGLTVSGLMTLPPARFTGKRPVWINIHGGPEAQATMGFGGRNNFMVQELGVAFIQPNVRGSTGYGKTFLALDNGFKREDAVKDIGALLDWIATQPQLDASRVLVSGGSYGGYMSLAVAAHYADRITGNIDVVGISNFVTFLTNTESYRRDLRRVEYGDERDPAMREFQQRISPLTNAHRITKPLFVVQGKNDPRVPYTEAEQIVAKARENGTPVWYLRAENEGHGFSRKENADFQFYATLKFMEQTLLK
jgi:dipeptidyl aminopeptidase/acylaminoacyl peptidase